MRFAIVIVLFGNVAAAETPAAKFEPPPAVDIAKARLEIADAFGNEIARAKTLLAKKAVAVKMLGAANDSKETIANRWALYAQARDLAVATGDIALAFQAVDDWLKTFQADRKEIFRETADRLSKAVTPANAKPLLDQIMKYSEQAVEADEYDEALKLLTIGNRVAQANVAAGRRLEAAVRRAKELAKAFSDAKSNEEQLGRFYCLRKGNWAKGLPLLVKSPDPALAALAKRDLASPTDAKERIDLANEWYEMAEKVKGDERNSLLRRAYHWFRLEVGNLAGVAKARVEGRMREAVDQGAVPDAEKAIYRPAPVGGNGGGEFEQLPLPHCRLVGFVVHSIAPNNSRYVHAIQPIFLDPEGKRYRGPAYGTQTGDETLLEAPAGYVLTGIVVRSGNRLDGFQAKFEPIAAAKGKKPIISALAGGTGGSESVQEMAGKKVVGVRGRCGSDIDSLGLIFSD